MEEDAPVNIKDGNVIKRGYNQELDELKLLKFDAKKFIAKFESEEKEKTGIKNLKVGYNRVFGYYIEVSKGNVDLVKEEYGYERRQTLSNCERYISPILKEKESLILNAEDKIISLEQELFSEIKEIAKQYIPIIQDNANIIALIDALSSLAIVASDNKYIRPTINESNEVYIKDGRHPVIELANDHEFVPNDIIFDKETNILLITGPNMAGKSTYLRQMALITIMHQMGSFIPAKEAKLPIFDAIYTRIGASDDLVSGESTFMVEMIEAKNAIVNATSNSLILFDELGRGTATFDGIAIAQAILEYIATDIKCKTMFSTHYHELVDLEESLPSLKKYAC
ncbi:MAG: DNA mismatch repair protein MutS [Bacilli bacterium]|nr:DNA mismatch repair protein MutS [Bacilli bacterium]